MGNAKNNFSLVYPVRAKTLYTCKNLFTNDEAGKDLQQEAAAAAPAAAAAADMPDILHHYLWEANLDNEQ